MAKYTNCADTLFPFILFLPTESRDRHWGRVREEKAEREAEM